MITRDSDVRAALMKNVISDHIANPDTLVVQELGLNRGSCRVDVAVVNGLLHGYEIKSDADTLSRLPSQVISYSAVLDKATLVVGASHTMRALSLIPDWWGVRIVKTGARGAVLIEPLRPARMNDGIDATALALLLWRDELVGALASLGVEKSKLRAPRAQLAQTLAEVLPLKRLRPLVRERVKNRTGWRCYGLRQQHDETLLP
ncbi:sce7726 family protein [Xanthomonas cannabis]|uniref:sce7726 family protein n=1 Tax=Xanthomonas cannabis TaxID=1885674 RepID=UPI001E4947D0|nr:sce7726 family protein [Xanthomonas cannabis]MCC8444767.1 sce7726 family protein [Xanthomonas cannabis]